MATAIIGQSFTFNALFLDATGDPVAVTSPMIQVFRFNTSGSKVVITTTAMSAVAGDTGRYTYTYDVPTSLSAGDTLYALMYGTDPGTSATIRVQVDVSLVATSTSGMTARFLP